jgi:hypothetical protein
MEINPETMFHIADDLLKAQSELINKQNDLIKRLMDRISYLENLPRTPVDGLKGLSLP